MTLNILKKDIKRKKTMNTILFIFITLCTVFLSSSINSLVMVIGGIDYFAERSELADYFIWADDSQELYDWISANEHVNTFQAEESIDIPWESIKVNDREYEASMPGIALELLPTTYNLVFDQYDQMIQSIEPGEIVIPYAEAARNEMTVGDTISLQIGEEEKDFTLSAMMKDMVFGSELVSPSRFLLSDADFEQVMASEMVVRRRYSVMVDDLQAFTSDLNQQDFLISSQFGQALVLTTFDIELIFFVIFITVGICLIIISLLVLRFAIVFTLQEDYKEIGIMKAIGFKSGAIQKIYMIKYLFIALAATVVGLVLNFPFQEILMRDVRPMLVLPSATIYMSIICAVIILVLVCVFCNFSTRKVNKFTVMHAIRSGEIGERYKRKSFWKLHTVRKVPAVVFLSLNDIFSTLKSYLILFIVFMIGYLLVILPTNLINTMGGDSMVELMGVGILETDVYINRGDYLWELRDDRERLSKELEELERFYQAHGIDIRLQLQYGYASRINVAHSDESIPVAVMQTIGRSADEYSYLRGEAPRLENEIAVTQVLLDQIGANIGDYVEVTIGNEVRSYLVTGSYQTLMNLGVCARFAETAKIRGEVTRMRMLEGRFVNRTDIEAQIEQLREVSLDHDNIEDIMTTSELLDQLIGVMRSAMEGVQGLILTVVLLINFLIAFLMSKSFFTKDLSQIALLKNLGFRNLSIRLWQGSRIVMVMVVALIFGMTLVRPLSATVGSIPFRMLGGEHVDVEVAISQVYILYPAILLSATFVALVMVTMSVNKVGLRDMGNAE